MPSNPFPPMKARNNTLLHLPLHRFENISCLILSQCIHQNAGCRGPQQKEKKASTSSACGLAFLNSKHSRDLNDMESWQKRSVQNGLQTISVGQSLVTLEKGLKSMLGFVGFANLTGPTVASSNKAEGQGRSKQVPKNQCWSYWMRHVIVAQSHGWNIKCAAIMRGFNHRNLR